MYRSNIDRSAHSTGRATEEASRCRRLWAAVAIVSVSIWTGAGGAEDGPSAAIARAVERLKESPELAGLKGPGPAALTAMALVAAGENPGRPPLKEAIDYVERQAFSAPENQYVGTYVAAVSLTLLHMVGRDAASGGSAVGTLAKRLLAYQEKDGSWGDVSRSQFAALGLYAARAMNVQTGIEAFQRLRNYILSMQNPDGGWPYKDRGTVSTGSMTAGALAALHVVERALAFGTPQCSGPRGVTATERAIERGVQWLAKNQSYTANPGSAQYYYYYIYSLERAMKYLGIKQLGTVDWYSQAAARVLDLQSASGVWPSPATDYGTQFATLFLSRSGWPAAIAKVQHGDDWNLDRYDAEIWAEDLSRRLHMPSEQRVVTLDEPLEYLLQTPLIYITGRNALSIKDSAQLKLSEYVDKGGMVLFAAGYKGKAFVESARALLDGLFPDNPLLPVDPLDPLYMVPNNVDAGRVPMRAIMKSCRVAVILLEAPISCALSGCSSVEGSGYSGEELRRLAVNIGYYALGTGGYFKEKQRKEEYDFEPLDGAKAPEEGQVEFHVGWLRYRGDWHPFPEALGNLLMFVNRETERVWWWKEVQPLDKDLHRFPLLFMTGSKAPQLSKEEKEALRRYIERGGRLVAEPACGNKEFVEGLRALFQDMLPECRLERIMPEHPIYSSLFTVSRVEYKDIVLKSDPKLAFPWLEGVYWQGRLVAVYSPFNLSVEWAEKGYVHSRGVKHRDAYALGANMLAYFFIER